MRLTAGAFRHDEDSRDAALVVIRCVHGSSQEWQRHPGAVLLEVYELP